MIYIIGDSHVSIFSGIDTKNGRIHIQPEFGYCYTLSQGQLQPSINQFEKKIPHFLAIKVGSHTAYNSFNKLSKIEQVISEYNIGLNDFIFMSFGQIDIQNHLIPRKIKDNITIKESIQICVDRYIETLIYIKDKYTNIKVGAYGPPSTSIGCGNNPKISQKESIEYNRITLSFNDYLKIKCEENGILFKEISKKLLNSDQSTNNEFVVDDIHLSIKAIPLILEEFSDIVI
jgi:hypothetical protein